MAGSPPKQSRHVSRNIDPNWELEDPGAWAAVPVLGPAYEAAYDVQEGNYGSALFNGATALAEFSPLAPAIRIARLVKLMRRYKDGLASANAMQKRFRP